jgi:hypothetical protein
LKPGALDLRKHLTGEVPLGVRAPRGFLRVRAVDTVRGEKQVGFEEGQ